MVDIVMDTYNSVDASNLETILTAGNTSTLDIVFKEGAETKLTIGPSGMAFGNTTINADGIKDGGKQVLSAKAGMTISEGDAAVMRGYLNTYSKTEIDAKLASAIHAKGSVNAFADLPTDAAVGDMYNVKTAGGTDIHGNAIKAGDNVVYVAAQGEDPAGWDVFAGMVDTSALQTGIDEAKAAAAAADAKATNAATAAATAQTTAEAAQTAAEGAQSTADQAKTAVDTLGPKVTALENAGYQTESDVQGILTDGHYVADENYVHTDTNYTAADAAKVAKIVTDGAGTKVLTDKGTYDTLDLSVVSI